MSKISDIRNCHVCRSTNLEPIPHVPVVDFFTDEEEFKDVVMCNDCDTMHYIDMGQVSYEFSYKIDRGISSKEITKIKKEV